jgi:spoIIIJ-associated protein
VSETDVTGPSGDSDDNADAMARTPGEAQVAGAEDVSAESEDPTSELAADVPGEADPHDGFPDDGDEDSDDGDDRPSASRRARRVPSLKRLEEEGEVAADYLEELLDITDLDGDIDIDVENGRASVAIVAEEDGSRQLRRLVGPNGEVLEALQELSRLAVQSRTGERSRMMLDVAGFRAAKKRAVEAVAHKVCKDVAAKGKPVTMEPMSAFERKVVHDVVAGAGLHSESEGEEPSRRVVVFPVSG